jgi:VanZ family protein
MEEAAGLLTRGSLSHRLPGCRSPSAASDVSVGEQLPSQRRDRPGFAPGSLTALPSDGGAYHRTVSAATFRAWAPVVVMATVIFVFSSIPSLGTGLGTWDTVLRKAAHLTEYAVLGALLLRALARPKLAILFGGLYAVSDEVHQHFVRGRHAVWYDVVIDTLGVTLGVIVWSRSRWSRNSKDDTGTS